MISKITCLIICISLVIMHQCLKQEQHQIQHYIKYYNCTISYLKMGMSVSNLENAVKLDLTDKNVQKPKMNQNKLISRSMDFPPIAPQPDQPSMRTSLSVNYSSRFFNKQDLRTHGIECTTTNDLSGSSCRLSKILSKLGEEQMI